MDSLPCPACGHPLTLAPLLSVTVPDLLTVEAVLAAVDGEGSTVRQVAGSVLGRPPSLAELERVRRRLNAAVRDGRLRVHMNEVWGAAVYSLMTLPATG